MNHGPEKALAPGERLSSTSSIFPDLAEKIGTVATPGAACLDENVVEWPGPTNHLASIRGQAIKVPRAKRRGLLGKFSIVAEVGEPKDYPRRTKWFITFVVGMAALAAPLGSTIIFRKSPAFVRIRARDLIPLCAAALPRIIDHFNSTATVANLAVSLYLLGMAIFPLWWSSFSETLGRRTIYLISFSLFVLFSILLAESRSITMLIVLRMLVGGASASVQGASFLTSLLLNRRGNESELTIRAAVGAGTIADIWEVKERGRAMGVFYLGPLLGPLFGPIIGGLLAQNLGWRSTQWFLAVYGAVLVLSLFFALPETLKAPDSKSLETQPNSISIDGQSDLKWAISRRSLQQNTKKWLKISKRFLIDPLKIILYLRFPAVLITIYYASITFSCLYLLNISIEVQFSEVPYNFSPLLIGLSYIPSSVGYLVASVAGGRWTDQIMAREAKKAGRFDENGRLVYRPEDRMRENAWVAAFLYPAALVWFGWTAEKGVHWAVPVCPATSKSSPLIPASTNSFAH